MASWLDRLNRRFGHWAVPNITEGLICGQVAAFLLNASQPEFASKMMLVPERVMDGEVWRLATFVFYPPITNPVFALFGWYLLWLMGSALEAHWGAFRYDVYLLISYVATVVASFVVPGQASTNVFMLGSVFLAFAALYPNFYLSLFFLLPVKIKYFALVAWLGYGWMLLEGSWEQRLLVVAAIGNFVLFFHREIRDRLRLNYWLMSSVRRRAQFDASRRIIHRCTICGATQDSHPQLEFRYCSKCQGSHAYCSEHLRDHEHLSAS